MFNISVLVSGEGSTLDNLAHHCYDENEGMIRGFVNISRVFADRDCPASKFADKWDLPFEIISRKDYEDDASWSKSILCEGVDLHIMGGFLSRVVVPEGLEGKILNIHPSLLPAYGGQGMYGSKIHESVIANGEKFTGVTVHVVDNEYDHGEIVEQIKLAVLPWDNPKSLEYAVQNMERLLYPRAILNFLRKQRLPRIAI